MRTALVTGADRGFGFALVKEFVDKGWRVFAGRYLTDWPELDELAHAHPELVIPVDLDIGSDESVRAAVDGIKSLTNRIDLVVNNAAVNAHTPASIEGSQDYDDIMRTYNVNALGALRVVDAVLPLIDRGDLKRLCFVSSEAGSVERCRREAWFGYCMSKRALNMGVNVLFEKLHPRGYTLRLFHPGWMRTYMSGTKNMDGELEPEEVAALAVPYFVDTLTPAVDEDRLIMRDWLGREWPW